MKLFRFSLLFLLAVLGQVNALPFGNESVTIRVNNRILAIVIGKPITVMDVMKKMDILFLKQFPEYAASPQARYQYYQVNWKHVLQELIDKELVLADAKENKLPVSAGDVRQEMETLFGPQIITNLDSIGISFDEAFKIVEGDLLIRRMMLYRVNGKVMRRLTPQVIREAYEDFAKKNVKEETYHYQVVTVRNKDSSLGAETASRCHHLLTADGIPLDSVVKKIKEETQHGKSQVAVSEAYFHTLNDVVDWLKEPLKNLTPGSFSQPIAQKSRDNSMAFRIVYLDKRIEGGAIPYQEISAQLKEELFEKELAQESEAYLTHLRRRFFFSSEYLNEQIPADFQPFSLVKGEGGR